MSLVTLLLPAATIHLYLRPRIYKLKNPFKPDNPYIALRRPARALNKSASALNSRIPHITTWPQGSASFTRQKLPNSRQQRTAQSLPHANHEIDCDRYFHCDSPLLKLPTELRLSIYEYALAALHREEGEICAVTRELGIGEPALLLTCKVTRKETTKISYTGKRFCLVTKACHPAAEVLMARKIAVVAMLGVDAAQLESNCSHLNYGRPDFRNLTLWLQHLHQGEAIGGCHLAVCRRGCYRGSRLLKFLNALTQVVKNMEGLPWVEVKEIINGLGKGLIAMHEE